MVLTRWGKTELRVKRWYCGQCKIYGHSNPIGLDGSGLSPAVLENLIFLTSHLSYRESQEALKLQRIELSVGQCEQKHHKYAAKYEEESKSRLIKQATELLPKGEEEHWVIEIDGMYVMERDKPIKGQSEGREIKQTVLYPLSEYQNKPKNNNNKDRRRYYLNQAGNLEQFAMLNQGMLKQWGFRRNDKLIGLADGAPWIDNLFDELGVEVRILDVIHATQYLDIIMQAMGWNEEKRSAERASWMRADLNARVWLKEYLPDPEIWLCWDEKVQKALKYLEDRLEQMDYYDFKKQNYPIASGVIEGAANSVIAARMRRSGMRWTFSGINRMANLRAEYASSQTILDFNQLRLLAFP